jgi:flagellar motility protein MotE (MotC chaperone)
MSHAFGIVIESLVAALLMLTIGYCMLLNGRLKRLKADEHSLKATIAELITATEIAERAIGGLKHTVRDVNENLGDQLAAAAQLSQQLKKQLAEGDGQARRRGGTRVRPRARAGQAAGGQGHRRGRPGIFRTQKGQRSRRMKPFRDIRVLPVVLVAIVGLAVLKVAGLVIDGGYVFDYQPQSNKKSWAQETLNFPTGGRFDPADITGSTHEKPKEEATKPAAAPPEVAKPDGVVVFPEQNQQPVSASERAILERLQARRQELDARAREVDIRESLLKAAEKRIESRVEELKAVETRITTATGQKAETDTARFKGIITMYEGMKPKDAAKVFDRLEMSVLLEIATQIAPRKMSDILGLMQADAAERLTVEMARRAGSDKSAAAAELPKIEGKAMPPRPN